MMNLGWPNFHPPDPDDDAEKPIHVDERWIPEWIDFGMEKLDTYLKRHADFAAWLDDHHKGDAA